MYKGLTVTDYDREVYEKELKGFLPENIIDFHTHVEEESFTRQGSHNGGSSWTDCLGKSRKIEDLVDFYERTLPDKKVTPLIFGGCLCDLDEVNSYVYNRGKEYGFPALYRTSYDMSPEVLEEEVTKGGFLGLKPYLSNCPEYIPPKEIRIFDFLPHSHLEVANRHGWIVMLHIPRDKRFRDEVNLAELHEIEVRYPNVKLIIAHIGRAYAKEDIGNAFEVVGKGKNTYFDFTANLSDDAIRACLEAVGPKKLIFGSDLPIAIMRMYRIVEDGVYYNVVPKGLYGDVTGQAHMRETDEKNVTIMFYEQLLAFKRVAKEMGLTAGDIEDVMYNNAKKLIEETR